MSSTQSKPSVSRHGRHVDLIAKLEGLTKPDREVDYAVYYLSKGVPERAAAIERIHDPYGFNECVLLRSGGASAGFKPPRYTASLDAALALVGEKLPGWEGEIDFGCLPHACLHPAPPYPVGEEFNSYGNTPALAVLIALLKALDAAPPTPADRDHEERRMATPGGLQSKDQEHE